MKNRPLVAFPRSYFSSFFLSSRPLQRRSGTRILCRGLQSYPPLQTHPDRDIATEAGPGSLRSYSDQAATLLKNIITQDLHRVVGTPEDPHRIPMVIFDGKGDLEFFQDLLPHIHLAARLKDLRVLNPARPDISVCYNPFHCTDCHLKDILAGIKG